MLPKRSSKRHQEGAGMCFGQSPLGEKRLLGAHLAADAGRLRTSSRTLQTASLPNRVGREHSRPPQFRVHQLAATGHIGTAGVPRGSYLTPGRVPDLSDSRLGAAVQSQGRPGAGSPKPRAGSANPAFSQLGDSVGSRGAGGGGGRGVFVGMSVAVLACWRPISQMSFATIKKCGGVKWRFHIQQRKGGFTWELGRLQLEVGGGNLSPSSQFPLLTSMPKFTPPGDINERLRPPMADRAPSTCGCWVGFDLARFPLSPSP